MRARVCVCVSGERGSLFVSGECLGLMKEYIGARDSVVNRESMTLQMKLQSKIVINREATVAHFTFAEKQLREFQV